MSFRFFCKSAQAHFLADSNGDDKSSLITPRLNVSTIKAICHFNELGCSIGNEVWQ